MPCGMSKKSSSVIDEGIRPLVDAMNGTGLVRTIASCQGHAGLHRPPYVYFDAPVAVAASFERALRERFLQEGSKLKHLWLIEGSFDGEYRLRFLLHSPSHDEHSRSAIGSIAHFRFRSKLDGDLRQLCIIVQDAVLDLRPQHEPEIGTSNDCQD